MLVLEGFQAGLSWECVLNKREAFRNAFDGFDCNKVAQYDDKIVDVLMQNKNIVRNRLKIKATIINAQVFVKIVEEMGCFFYYLRLFWDGKTIFENTRTTSGLSDVISKDLQKRGMKFVGSTIIYSYLQAIGIINSHDDECFLFGKKL
jgi:DNA-3-methyladenine glycosylase I